MKKNWPEAITAQRYFIHITRMMDLSSYKAIYFIPPLSEYQTVASKSISKQFPFTSRIKPLLLPTRVVNLKGKLQTINNTDLVVSMLCTMRETLRSTCQFDHVSTDSWYLIIPEQLTSANPELQRKEREMSAQLPKKQNTNVILDMENTKSSTKWNHGM